MSKKKEFEYVNSPTENAVVFILLLVILILFIYILYKLRHDIKKKIYRESFTMDNFDIYYINLDRRKDRGEKCENELKKSDLLNNYKKFSAIDGTTLNLEKYRKFNINDLEKKRGWIGCAESHISLWEKCINENKNMLIFEDDVILIDEYDKNMRISLQNLPDDFDIIFYTNRHNLIKMPSNKYYYKLKDINFNLNNYLISPNGARKLIKEINPFIPTKKIELYIKDITNKGNLNTFLFKLSDNDAIPKVIYMCHKNLDNIKKYSQNWKRLNPEYDIKLYDDELCKKFLLEEYSQLHLDIFNFIRDGPIKSDFWRVCIINKYGGLYVDADIEPVVPLKTFIEDDDDFVTCISTHFNKNKTSFNFNPHFILCNKNNKILNNCIQQYIDAYKNRIKYSYWGWSICKFFKIDNIEKKESHVKYIDNIKYKFLLELPSANDCEYNGVIVLHNRYNNYKNHNFIEN